MDTKMAEFKNLFTFALVIATAANAFAAVTTKRPTTTHAPTTTQEPREYEKYLFSYSWHSQHLYVRIETPAEHGVDRRCYIAHLSEAEQTAVHTDLGLRALELKMLALLSTAQEIPLSDLVKDDGLHCPKPGSGTLRAYMVGL